MKPVDKLAPFYPYKPTSDLKNKHGDFQKV